MNEDSSILWVVAALVAVLGFSTPGCTSNPAQMSNAPIPSPSDTNVFHSGALSSDASDVSKTPTDIPSMNGTGTTGSLRSRR
jgi:hypothetical protein